ncbi:MAG: hypothetical protein Q7U32_08685, partial [Rhodocyclaceae bacterium]|nr:hypothetical protein [Rhodocyclaceae bacterium]
MACRQAKVGADKTAAALKRLLDAHEGILPEALYNDRVTTLPPLLDTLGRSVRDLRISVTDRCNFRCVYCMPKTVFGRDYP